MVRSFLPLRDFRGAALALLALSLCESLTKDPVAVVALTIVVTTTVPTGVAGNHKRRLLALRTHGDRLSHLVTLHRPDGHGHGAESHGETWAPSSQTRGRLATMTRRTERLEVFDIPEQFGLSLVFHDVIDHEIRPNDPTLGAGIHRGD